MGAVRRFYSNSAGASPPGAWVVGPTLSDEDEFYSLGLDKPGINGSQSVAGPNHPGRNLPGINLTGNGGLLGNPHFPCIAGPEILPLGSSTVIVDTGTGYLFDGHKPSTSIGVYPQYAVSEWQLAAARQQHLIAFDMYSTGNDESNDEITLVTLPIDSAFPGTTVTVTDGGTALNALSSPGGAQVVFDAALTDSGLTVVFDASQLTDSYPESRIGRVGIRFIAWRDNAAPNPEPGEGFDVYWLDVGSKGGMALHGSWAVTDYESNSTYTTRWLGETNLISRGRRNVYEDGNQVQSFTAYDITRMDAGQAGLRIIAQPSWDLTQTVVYLDYIEMVIEVLPERRSNTGTRIISSLWGDDYGPDADREIPLVYSLNDQFTIIPLGEDWTLMVREAQPADPSDRYRAIGPTSIVNAIQQIVVNQSGLTDWTITFDGQTTGALAPLATAAQVQTALIALSNIVTGDVFVTGDAGGPYTIRFAQNFEGEAVPTFTVTTNPPGSTEAFVTVVVAGGQLFQATKAEAIGPSLELKAVQQYRGTRTLGAEVTHRQAVVSNGRIIGTPAVYEPFALAATLMDETYETQGAWWASYQQQAYPTDMRVAGLSDFIRMGVYVDGTQTYDRFKILAKPDAMTIADLRIVASWGGVAHRTVSISPDDVRDLPDVGNGWREFAVEFTPITPPAGWVTLDVDSVAGATLAPWWVAGAISTGDYSWTGYDPADEGGSVLYTDFALTMLCEMDVPPAPSAVPFDDPITPASAGCGADTIPSVTVSFDPVATADRYIVERSSDNGVTWSTISVIDETGEAFYIYYDIGAPWDVDLEYRVSAYRYNDRTQTTSPSTSVAALPAPGPGIGISPPCFSGDPLNDCDTVGLYYSPTEEAGTLSIVWDDLTTYELVQLHGENYQRALHPREDRGLRVTMNVLVEALQMCVGGEVVNEDVGQASLAPTPYEVLRELTREPYVNVVWPGGFWRTMHLQLGPLTVRTEFGVYLAQITLTDAAPAQLIVDPEAV